MNDLPQKVKSWIGKTVIKENNAVKLQRGLWQNFCAAVEDGNPLYWDDEKSKVYTDELIAPPAMLPSWVVHNEWHPNKVKKNRPMELHFLLKEELELPLGIVTNIEMKFYEPVKEGDSISSEQKLVEVSGKIETKLGPGRKWNIEVTYKNQRNVIVGLQNMHFLGYKKDE